MRGVVRVTLIFAAVLLVVLGCPSVIGQEAPKQESEVQETAGQEAIVKDTAEEEAIVKEDAGQEAAVKEAAVKEAAVKEAAVQKSAVQEDSEQKAAGQESEGQEAALEETEGQEAIVKEEQVAIVKEAAGQENEKQEASGHDTEESTTAKLIETLDKTLLGVQNNLYKGMTSLGTPMIKFQVDTVPHLVHLFILTRGIKIPSRLAATAKSALGHAALMTGTISSDAAVLGSTVLKNVAEVAAVALEAQNNITSEMGEKGVESTGELIESLINATSIGVDAAAVAMTALGDTLLDAAQVHTSMSTASSGLLTALGAAIQRGFLKAKKSALSLESPVLTEAAREHQTTNLASYLTTLNNAQKAFEKLVVIAGTENTDSKS